MKIRSIYFLILLTLLAGCNSSSKYAPPDLDMPCHWNNPPPPQDIHEDEDMVTWWKSFNDPILEWLIETASEQNIDLYIAMTRICEARYERKGAEAPYYPRIDATCSNSYLHTQNKIVNHLFDNNITNKKTFNLFEAGFDADWELDFFGKGNYDRRSLQAKLEATEENYYDIWITLSAEIARNYVELRGYQHRLVLLDNTLQDQKEAISLLQELNKTGLQSSVENSMAEELLYQFEAERPLLLLAADKVIYRLAILLGYAPGDLMCVLAPPGEIPAIPDLLCVGMPSDLLRRRPDIRVAERQLAAATESVGSAIADMFPRLSIRGFIGDIATNLKSFNIGYFLSPRLIMPLLNSSTVKQDVTINRIRAHRACFEYQKTVLNALEEAELAMATLRAESDRSHALFNAYRSSQKAYDFNKELYTNGLRDYRELLISHKNVSSTQDAYTQSQVALLSAYISLYKAMGGTWK